MHLLKSACLRNCCFQKDLGCHSGPKVGRWERQRTTGFSGTLEEFLDHRLQSNNAQVCSSSIGNGLFFQKELRTFLSRSWTEIKHLQTTRQYYSFSSFFEGNGSLFQYSQNGWFWTERALPEYEVIRKGLLDSCPFKIF